MSMIPKMLRNSLAALSILAAGGGSTYYVYEVHEEAKQNSFLHAVAADPDTSEAVKIAMVMAHYYESSNRHIGKPYVDKLGKGQPLTVCNGITGKEVIASKIYTPSDCYQMEKRRYVQAEKTAASQLTYWDTYGAFSKASFLDFIHNKGSGALQTSTMRMLANKGDLAGACQQNPRWNKGTVSGVLTVLPGLDTRAKSNWEICLKEGGL